MQDQPVFFEMALHKAGIDPATASEELGLSPRQVKRYITGECQPPKLVRNRMRELVSKRSAPSSGKEKFRFVDLFVGIGGMRPGFEAIGGTCVFTTAGCERSHGSR